MSSDIVPISKPLPTKSSMYNQKNCITNTNNEIKKVAKKGPINERIISVSSFFITLSFLYRVVGLLNAHNSSMMSNVKLSSTEIELVNNASIILTKNKIIGQVYNMFGNLATTYLPIVQTNKKLPQEVVAISPKISRGENYEGLPWVMLDYPRYFTKNNVFAIRTYFWWGNFCSITLQLKGRYLNDFSLTSFNEDWFLSYNINEWQHHFREDNFMPLHQFTNKEIENLSFIKLSKKISLQQWDGIELFLKNGFEELIENITSLENEQ